MKKKFQCGLLLEIGSSDETLTLLHSERPKLHRVLAFLSAVGLRHMLRHGKKGPRCRGILTLILGKFCLPYG